jgi:hypothetical protein
MGFSTGTLASASLGTQAYGGAASTVGSYYAARSQADALQMQAGVDDVNAKLSEQGARSALQQGQRREQNIRLRTADIKSAQTASFAANGIDPTVGSAARVTTSAGMLGEIDADTAAADAVRAAWGYRTQGTNYTNDALTKRAGADAISPLLSAFSSFAGSSGRVADSWYRYSSGNNSSFNGYRG